MYGVQIADAKISRATKNSCWYAEDKGLIMTQKRLDKFTTADLKQIFFNHCVRVEFAYKENNNYSAVTVLIAKKNQNKELFRVQKNI